MLISTKTHPVQPKAGLLDRKHLIQKLNSGSQSQLTMITGPAGYGKTSLALQWINFLKPCVAWYSLDEADNDPDLFLRYLMTALITTENGCKEAFNPLIFNSQPLTPDDVIPLIIHTLNTFQKDIFFVFDDFHLISNEIIHNAFIRFLNYLPNKVHVIILSRHKLPQIYSRVIYHHDTEEITTDDLKLTVKEADDFFKVTIPLELTHKQIRELLKITGGWVTGFQIFGLSQKNKRTNNQPQKVLKVTGRESIGYLVSEVVNMQSERVKAFLSKTSVLYRFNSDLCQYVTGDSDSQKILKSLYQQNLFLIPLDSDHSWYRYHHLFSEAIREWTKTSSPELLEKTRKKAARWCAENNNIEEAFQYALASGDFELLADLMEEYLVSLLFDAEFSLSIRWIAKLPRGVFLRRPILRLMECRIAILQMRISEVTMALPEIEEQFNALVRKKPVRNEQDHRDQLTYLKMVLDCEQNLYDIDIEQANEKINRIASRNKSFADHIKSATVVKVHMYRGDFKTAEEELTNALQDIVLTGNDASIARSYALLAGIQTVRGRLQKAENALLRAFGLFKKRKAGASVKFVLYIQMAWIFFARNDLDKALEYGVKGLAYFERNGLTDPVIEIFQLFFTIWMMKGDLKKAKYFANKIKSLAESNENKMACDISDILLNNVSIAQGDTEAVKNWISKGPPDRSKFFMRNYVDAMLCYGISHLIIGELAKSRHILDELRVQCMEKNMLATVFIINTYLSVICFFMGETATAVNFLEQAIRFSEKEYFISPFVSFGGAILPILKHLREDSHPISRTEHFMILLKICEARKPEKLEFPKAQPSLKPFGLTQREIEILGHISDGYKNEQIADLAFISVGTVKVHIHHILKKLNVQNRTQAALKAKEFLY